MKYLLPLFIAVCFCGCDQNELGISKKNEEIVHLAGVLTSTNGNSVASYWKDGIYEALMNDTTVFSRVTSLDVDGNSVLIGGQLDDGRIRGVTWQNGQETIVDGAYGNTILFASNDNHLVGVWEDDSLCWVFNKNGQSQQIVDTASFFPTALATTADDVFIVGNAKGYRGNHYDYSNMYAQLWKNQALMFRESVHSYVNSIFVHGGDVYMAGYLYIDSLNKNVACFWKNGQRTDLSVENGVFSRATSIFVTDNHVYVVGERMSRAVYWVDGVVSYMEWDVRAKAIFVKGQDIYVAGSYQNHLAYWKNKIRQDLPNQHRNGSIDFIVVD